MKRMAWVFLCALGLTWASNAMMPTRQDPFNRNSLLKGSSLQLANPKGFSMQQSYTVQFSGGSFGSVSSGLYLNTLSYEFGIPLTLSVDIGMYNMFHASFQNSVLSQYNQNFQDTKPELVIPRISLDYKPSEKVSLSLQILNTQDAVKAYGADAVWGSFWRQR